MRWWSAAVISGGLILGLSGTTGREHSIVRVADPEWNAKILTQEDRVAAEPSNVRARTMLAQTYLDVGLGGHALSVISATNVVPPELEHVRARALFEEGRASDALMAETRVLDECAKTLNPPCPSWLTASATYRADLLRRLVEAGIEDAREHARLSDIAVSSATRPVTFEAR